MLRASQDEVSTRIMHGEIVDENTTVVEVFRTVHAEGGRERERGREGRGETDRQTEREREREREREGMHNPSVSHDTTSILTLVSRGI